MDLLGYKNNWRTQASNELTQIRPKKTFDYRASH